MSTPEECAVHRSTTPNFERTCNRLARVLSIQDIDIDTKQLTFATRDEFVQNVADYELVPDTNPSPSQLQALRCVKEIVAGTCPLMVEVKFFTDEQGKRII